MITTPDYIVQQSQAHGDASFCRSPGHRVRRAAVLPAVARLAHAHRGDAWHRRPDARAVRAAERHRRPRGSHPAGTRDDGGHRSQHDGLADRPARERRPGHAPAFCNRPPSEGDCDHGEGPPAPATCARADLSGGRRGAGRAHAGRAPRPADAPSPHARLGTCPTAVGLEGGGLAARAAAAKLKRRTAAAATARLAWSYWGTSASRSRSRLSCTYPIAPNTTVHTMRTPRNPHAYQTLPSTTKITTVPIAHTSTPPISFSQKSRPNCTRTSKSR